jgi:hypothetical protein
MFKVSVEEIDDSVTVLEGGTVRDVTKLGRIDLPVLHISQTHTDIHIDIPLFPE